MNNYFITGLCVLFLAAASSQSRVDEYNVSQGFVAHEWGTFTTLQTSDGRLLSGLHKEEEALPPFAYSLCNCFDAHSASKGVYETFSTPILNVTVKMETPVLYFYNPGQKHLHCRASVEFNNGSVSQWYPQRATGEPVKEPRRWSPAFHTNDFAKPRKGHISWNFEIEPHGLKKAITNKREEETAQWIAPRATGSDFVTVVTLHSKGWDPAANSYVLDTIPEVEKFLFYRGLANFNPPLKMEYNVNGDLVLTNTGWWEIPFILVYEKLPDGETRTYWTGKLHGRRRALVRMTGEIFPDPAEKLKELENALVEYGLFKDEAAAMLNTWKESYFDQPGVKAFWIVPGSFVDEILPLQIQPAPAVIKRVFIGRSEIIKRESELFLLSLNQKAFDTLYKDDRFQFAYQQFRKEAFLLPLTDFDSVPATQSTTAELPSVEEFKVFPNPSSSGIFNLQIPGDASKATNIRIFEANGRMVFTGIFGGGAHELDLRKTAPAMYYLEALLPDGIRIVRKIARD